MKGTETLLANAKSAAKAIAYAVSPNEVSIEVNDHTYKVVRLTSNVGWEFVLTVSQKGAYNPKEYVLSYARQRRSGKFFHGDINVFVNTAGLVDARRFLRDLPEIVKTLKSTVDLSSAAVESEKVAKLLS